ncbi:MAG: sensor histidine kinase [Saprospiraceae bacterium]
MGPQLEKLLEPKQRLATHVLFWMVYLTFFSILYGSFYESYERGFMEILTAMPIKMLATYFTLYLLIPQLLYKDQYLAFGFLFAISGLAFGYLARWVLHLWYVPIYLPEYDYESFPLYHFGKAAKSMLNVYTVVFAATVIKLLKRNYQNERIAEALHKQKLDAELNFLKGQIHPHFLFNTLNNLYALTLSNSVNAGEVVLKLSKLLDYMLYECNARQVPLIKEIKHLRNYIGLEKLRYGNRLEISFTASGDLISKNIPPLLLLPFVENAFKHGIGNDVEDGFISIDLSVKNLKLVLKVENGKTLLQEEPKIERGIGLKNVSRRLELLFKDRYQLQIFDEEDTYLVILKIELESNPLEESIPYPTQKNSYYETPMPVS